MGSARAFSLLCGISLTAAGVVHGRHVPVPELLQYRESSYIYG
jgi:hypothetical protein